MISLIVYNCACVSVLGADGNTTCRCPYPPSNFSDVGFKPHDNASVPDKFENGVEVFATQIYGCDVL